MQYGAAVEQSKEQTLKRTLELTTNGTRRTKAKPNAAGNKKRKTQPQTIDVDDTVLEHDAALSDKEQNN